MEPTIWLQAFAHMANRVNGRNAKARVSRGANEAMNLKRQEKNYLKTGPKRLRGSNGCLLYTSPSPRDLSTSRMPSSA